jgi:predicted nucleotidyltransferase
VTDATDSLVERLRTALAARPDVVCAWLFGSRARGDARPDSDVDVALLLDRDPGGTLPASGIAVAGELERVLASPVDVVVVDLAPPDLVHRVMRDGILLLDRDPGRRIAFEVAARNRWFDLQPIIAAYRRAPDTRHGRR